MVILDNMKSAIVCSTLVASAFASSTALAGTRDHMGLDTDPSCGQMHIIKEAVLDEDQVTATGRKASNDKWDIELYTNSKTGYWYLIGKEKAKPDSKLVCVLAHGDEPIAKQKWAVLFDKTSAPRIATAPIPKPTAN